MERRELQRRPTLAHQLSRIEPSNLRNLLKVGEDEGEAHAARRRPEAVTLATFLACEKWDFSSSSASAAAVSGRTLLDVIRDEEEPNRLFIDAGQNGSNKISWKAFKDRLRIRRATTAWSTRSSSTSAIVGDRSADEGELAVPGPGSLRHISVPEPEATSTTTFRSGVNFNSSSIASSSAVPVPVPGQRGNRAAAELLAPPQRPRTQLQQQEEPTRISLMALLEQSDGVANGGEGPSFAAAVMGLVEEDEEEVVATVGGGLGTSMHVCCVCMVRHKGAAFIPCGHTFCRPCSRDLWVSRGHCPLCNGFILEILDIF